MNKLINAKNILIIYSFLFMLSLLLKVDMVMLGNIVFNGIVLTYIGLKNEKIVIILAIFTALFYSKLIQISSVFQFLPIYIYILMLTQILIKKKIKINKTIALISMISLVLSLIPLIQIEFTLGNLFMSLMKRFGFIIVLTFGMNISKDKEILWEKIIGNIGVILIINLPLVYLQFKAGFDRDNITGVFGDFKTGVVIYLFIFYITLFIYRHYKKEISTLKLFIAIGLALFYCAIAEVKFGFVVLAVLLLIYFIFFQKKIKSIVLIIIFTISFVTVYSKFIEIYPKHDFLNKEFLIKYLYEQDYSGGTVNRFSFVNDLNESVLKDNYERLIGKGIGTGNVSKNNYLKGEVNKEFDYLKYYWFTLPYIYLEQGLLGIILYFLIYTMPLIQGIRMLIREKDNRGIIVIFMSLSNLMFIIYNDAILDYSIVIVYWLIIGSILTQNKGRYMESIRYEKS